MQPADGHDEVSRLVALGRDRDAARLHAARRVDPEPRGGAMDIHQQLDVILPDLSRIASGTSPDQMDAPTPCAAFTVRDLFNHMIGGAGFFAAQFRGEGAPQPPAPGTDLAGNDPVATFQAAMEALNASTRVDGALDRTVVAPFGEVPGAVVAQFLTLDGMVHAWDIAQATGQAYEPDEALAAQVLAFARQAIAPAMRDGDTFAAEQEAPAGASSLEQLVAFTGRRV